MPYFKKIIGNWRKKKFCLLKCVDEQTNQRQTRNYTHPYTIKNRIEEKKKKLTKTIILFCNVFQSNGSFDNVKWVHIFFFQWRTGIVIIIIVIIFYIYMCKRCMYMDHSRLGVGEAFLLSPDFRLR
ncbi:hypothetical protein RFI_37995 [Reticulomyxa filosa]|uniref:Uncharacterized protein n=1 Tax=Reticulomyxa filosa TaxID=46433 RepID=X6LED3_RETFI|nr:hypothetical protein RFI_37995 [Reticulomyxa filosa]|eukprot:ETN99476.1 hypothetical protein RFI_37995 [Reticulomyxa filosa]